MKEFRNTGLSCFGSVVAFSMILAIFKILGHLNWSWLSIFSPVLILILLFGLSALSVVLSSMIVLIIKEIKRKED